MKSATISFFLAACLAAIITIPGSPLFAEDDNIYTFIDGNGVLHFTNVPVSPNYRLYVKKIPEKPVYTYDSTNYDKLILMASKKHDVPFHLLKALIKVESDFNPHAVSKAGAVGLMQIMPFNFESFNINDPHNPWENVMGGTCYLKQLLKRFDGNVMLALAAYNAGPEAVERYNSVPPYPETERFIKKVMRYYYVLKKERIG